MAAELSASSYLSASSELAELPAELARLEPAAAEAGERHDRRRVARRQRSR